MPCRDYNKLAEIGERRFFDNPEINDVNKNHVRRFLTCYDVSSARKAIFFDKIKHLLLKTEDIDRDMHNRDVINSIFRVYREKYSPATYATIMKVGNCFVRWLNNGTKPKGFVDLVGVHSKKLLRKLLPDDMVTWEDGLQMAKATASLQLKSIVLTQLEAGFRPSEFVDLRYGDVKLKERVVVIYVRAGKTGQRHTVLQKSAPYFLRWYHEHPTKRNNDWLWIDENKKMSHPKNKPIGTKSSSVKQYNYDAMAKRVRNLGKKISLDKPLDFYNLRHSSAVLKKRDNMPPDLAAQSLGHGVDYYTKVYGRLCADDMVDRFSRHYGLVNEKKESPQNRICLQCNFVNEPEAVICYKCCTNLNTGETIKVKSALNDSSELDTLKQRLADSESLMQLMKEQILKLAVKEINDKQQQAA